MRLLRIALTMLLALTVAACGGSDSASSGDSAAGIRVASADQAAEIFADQPDDMVVLDVRTPEEFAEGHLEGATLVNFYDDDFADQLAELDPDVPYLLYCRSGNRSGQTRAIMDQLGFTDVVDIDGGIIAWTAGGHPLNA